MSTDNDLAPFTARVAVIDSETPVEQVINTMELIDEAMRRLRELKAEAEVFAVDRLRGRPAVVIGTRKYWAAPDTSYKCRSVRETVNFLMGLDLTALDDCLSSNAIKPGAFRKAVEAINQPHLFDGHFETVKKWKLADNGNNRPKLQSVDTRFIETTRKELPDT